MGYKMKQFEREEYKRAMTMLNRIQWDTHKNNKSNGWMYNTIVKSIVTYRSEV